MTATARKRTPAVVSTISKTEAMKAILAGGLNVNKYKRPCVLCEEIVAAGDGVLGGNKTEGWWAAHKDGKCVATEVKKSAPESESAGKVEPKIRNTRKVAAVAPKKTARRSTPVSSGRKPAVTPVKPVASRRPTKPNAPAPTKRTAAKKSVPTKPAPVVENESASDEIDPALKGLADTLTSQISEGIFDEILPMLQDAIDARLDAHIAKSTPAKKTAARKSTVSTSSRADKLAPVKRTARKTTEDDEMEAAVKNPTGRPAKGSASPAPKKPVRGREYPINDARLKSNGVIVKFMSLVPDSDGKKANVALVDDFQGKPAGFRFTVPTRALNTQV